MHMSPLYVQIIPTHDVTTSWGSATVVGQGTKSSTEVHKVRVTTWDALGPWGMVSLVELTQFYIVNKCETVYNSFLMFCIGFNL